MKTLRLILLLWAMLLAIKSNAAIKNLKIFATNDPQININQIIENKFTALFCDTSKCKFEANKFEAVYWVYFELENKKNEPLILELPMFFYNIQTYFFTDDMQYLDSVTNGYQLNINNRKYKTPTNAIQIPIKRKLKCFVRYKTFIQTGISITIVKNTDFINNKLKEHSYNGIINGIFFLAIIYSALFAFILRSRIYLYYMCYVISFWVFMQSISRVTPMYFSWLQIPFTFGFYIIPHYLMSIFLILYGNELLQLSKKLSIFSKINTIITLILNVLLIAYLTTGFEWRNNEINTIALFPTFLAAIILIYRKYTAAWFVFTGIALIFIAFVGLKLGSDIYIPLFFAFPIYGILEIIIFGISITYWLKMLFIEKEKATQLALKSANELTIIKENQNLILAKEVALKTDELKIANEQLEKYVQKVERLNVDLEKDNNSLKVEVIDQITARSEDKTMNFNEFKVRFPDEQSCYNRIENLKWNKDYVCPKCGQSKFLEYRQVNKHTKRRCSTCGFIDTSTSATLFHNIKFPIQKAFYLTYVMCTNKNKTLEELSLEIDLRTATIHAFSKKIKMAMKSTKLNKKNKDNWTLIILYNTKVKSKENNAEE
ncbi:MAG: hypothetical protein EAZ07_06075 [Cytophagales bacterium]|nr:MAG: hypothetical protein EAZ07_06075 [Cytophagales bacterium]